MPKNTPIRGLSRACLSATLGVTMAITAGLPATAAPAGDPDTPVAQDIARNSREHAVLSDSMKKAEGNIPVFVQFKGKGAYEQTQSPAVLANKQAPINKQAEVQAIKTQVQSQAQAAAQSTGAKTLYTTHNIMRGVALQGDAAQIRALANNPEVERITPIVPKKKQNAGSVVDTGAAENWARENSGYTGKDVKIAVVDSGIDYTHADFGGPGTVEAFNKATKLTEMPAADSGLYDAKKYIGGYDLVGDSYDGTNQTAPDNNPIDCSAGGHGTHVAGTAAGYGVNQDGTTFRGDYSKLTAEQLNQMKIGPGAAPEAQLYSFRVFGCTGTTAVVVQALDRTLDPNGDGDFSDRANIVNLSIGGEFSPPDDADAYAVESLNRQGVLAVVSAGNATDYYGRGDTYSDSGQPANAVSALTVANSIGSSYAVDSMEIQAPANVAGKVPGDYTVSYTYTGAKPEALTGTVVTPSESNKFGCEAFSAEDAAKIKDKWVFIEWANADGSLPCGSKVRFDNVEKAGGKGVVLSSEEEKPALPIGGNESIPGFRVAKSASAKVREAAATGELKVRLGADLKESLRVPSNKKDQLTASSARGYHGTYGYTKPDVAAPGNNISSARVGTGTDGISYTGTSMSAPFAAGVAAQVLQANQSYGPTQLKAAIMNSANHDVRTADGNVYAVDRVGSGRIDAKAAAETKVLLYNADRPAQVSQTFGVLEYAVNEGKQTLTREMTVENFDSHTHTYNISYAGSTDMPGVEFSLPSNITVNPGEKKNFTVTITIDPAAMEKTMDPAMEKTHNSVDPYGDGTELVPEQYRQFIASESGRILLTEGAATLRAPIHAAPKPASAMKVEGSSVEIPAGEHQANLKLTGTELNQRGYKSLLGAFEHGASIERTSPVKLDVSSNAKANMQHVGAASTAPALKASGGNPNDGLLAFGISTWANWDVVSTENTFTVNIDTDGNNRADYMLVTDRAKGIDFPIVRLYGYKNGNLEQIAYYPLNNAWGDTDTNMMDSNALVMAVPLKDLGLSAEKTKDIKYSVSATTQYAWTNVSETGWINYRPFDPKLWFSGTAATVPGFFADAPSSELVAHRAEGATDVKALFLHMHNTTGDLSGLNGAAGNRAQVLEVTEQQQLDPAPSRFTDVPAENQFYAEINWLAQRRITTGYPDGTFRPGENVERGAMAAFFYRLNGSPQFTPPTKPTFSDVPTNHPFYKEIEWMAARGITTGYGDGTFRPSASVNRDAMAAFFYRYANSPQFAAPAASPFKDVPANSQFYKEIAWLAEQGITKGWDDGTYRPGEPIHRDAMAAFLYRYSDKVLK